MESNTEDEPGNHGIEGEVMKKPIEEKDCVRCQINVPHDVHQLAQEGDEEFKVLAVVLCKVCGDSGAHVGSHTRLCNPCWELTHRLDDDRRVTALQIARVELVPSTLSWIPNTPITRMLINGVDIGITLGEGIQKIIEKALKLKVVKP